MPPVEIADTSGPKKQLRFVRNTSYAGKDYGPDYETDVAEVDSRWAAVFLANGHAVDEEETKRGPQAGAVQTRDPEAQHRDPELPLEEHHGTKKK